MPIRATEVHGDRYIQTTQPVGVAEADGCALAHLKSPLPLLTAKKKDRFSRLVDNAFRRFLSDDDDEKEEARNSSPRSQQVICRIWQWQTRHSATSHCLFEFIQEFPRRIVILGERRGPLTCP